MNVAGFVHAPGASVRVEFIDQTITIIIDVVEAELWGRVERWEYGMETGSGVAGIARTRVSIRVTGGAVGLVIVNALEVDHDVGRTGIVVVADGPSLNLGEEDGGGHESNDETNSRHLFLTEGMETR